MMISYIFSLDLCQHYCKFIYSSPPKFYVEIMSDIISTILTMVGYKFQYNSLQKLYLEPVSSVGSWGTSVFSKLLRKLLTFSWRVQSMPSTWSPEWLPSSNWGPFSTPCDTLSLGRSVPMVASGRDVLPVLSRDNWSGMTSSWWTLSWFCIFGGHDIFLIGLGGDDERDWGWCWDNFLL